jgi:hypothetical protein
MTYVRGQLRGRLTARLARAHRRWLHPSGRQPGDRVPEPPPRRADAGGGSPSRVSGTWTAYRTAAADVSGSACGRTAAIPRGAAGWSCRPDRPCSARLAGSWPAGAVVPGGCQAARRMSCMSAVAAAGTTESQPVRVGRTPAVRTVVVPEAATVNPLIVPEFPAGYNRQESFQQHAGTCQAPLAHARENTKPSARITA